MAYAQTESITFLAASSSVRERLKEHDYDVSQRGRYVGLGWVSAQSEAFLSRVDELFRSPWVGIGFLIGSIIVVILGIVTLWFATEFLRTVVEQKKPAKPRTDLSQKTEQRPEQETEQKPQRSPDYAS